MSEYSKIDTFLDIDKLKAEAQAFHKILDETIAKIRSFGTVEVKLSGGSSKEAIKAMGDINSLQVQLAQTSGELSKMIKAEAQAQQELKKQVEQAGMTYQQFIKGKMGPYMKELGSHGAAIRKIAAEWDAYKKATGAATTATEKHGNSELKASRAAAAAAKARRENAKAMEAEARYKERVRKESERIEKAQIKEEKKLADLSSDYKILSKAYEEAALKAKDMALVMGSNHPLAIEAAADAKRMADKLLELDAITGRHTRNVGNYQSATFALNQVLRETPSFVNSAQTGFMAISNNLPILSDEFKKLAKATGSNWTAFKTLASSLFGFHTLMIVGITLLTAYGKEIGEWVKELFKGRQAIDQMKMSMETYNKAMDSSSVKQAVTDINELRINIDLAKQGLLDKAEVVKQYNETIGKTTGEVKDLDEAERELTKNGDAYIKMMLLKAAANLALEEAAKKAFEAEQKRRKEAEEFLTIGDKLTGFGAGNVSTPGYVPNLQEQATNAQIKFNKDQSEKRKAAAVKQAEDEKEAFRNIANKFQTDAAQIAKDFNFNFFDSDKGSGSGKNSIESDLKSQFEIIKRGLEEQIKLYTDLANAEGMSIKSRQEARMKAGELTRELLRAERDFEITEVRQKLDESLKAEDLTAKGILTLRQNAANEIANIRDKADSGEREAQIDLTTDLLNIWGKYREQQKKQMEDDLKLFKVVEKDKEAVAITAASEAMQRRQNELSRARDILLKDLEQRRSQGTVGEKEYQKERLRIELEYNEKILLAELDFVKKSLEAKKIAGKDVSEELKKIAALELEIARKKNEELDKNDKDLQQRKIERIERIRDLSREAIDTIATFLTADVDRQKNAIAEQMELIDKKKAKEIEAAQQTTGSEEQKAAKIALINARAQSQKEALERRQRQLDIQRAQYEKAANIATIIANTAAAVVKQIATTPLPAGLPLVLAVGALGAAQLARAIAAPIPKFKQGTKDAPGGLAIVGDGGKQEIVITPAGETFITPDTPTFMNIPQHSIVHPDAGKIMDDLKYSAFANLRVSIPGQDPNLNDVIVSTLEREFKGLKQTIKNKKELHVSGTHAGVSALHRHNNNWLNYINDQVNF